MTVISYTTEEVAKQLHISKKTVRKLVKTKMLKPLPGIRHFRFPKKTIERFTGMKTPQAAG